MESKNAPVRTPRRGPPAAWPPKGATHTVTQHRHATSAPARTAPSALDLAP